jgi:hypothetical protein
MSPDKCQECKGRGQTRATETVMVKRAEPLSVKFRDGKARLISLRTIYLGSGCPVCHGTGIAPPLEEQLSQLMREKLAAAMDTTPAWDPQSRRSRRNYAPHQSEQPHRHKRRAA